MRSNIETTVVNDLTDIFLNGPESDVDPLKQLQEVQQHWQKCGLDDEISYWKRRKSHLFRTFCFSLFCPLSLQWILRKLLFLYLLTASLTSGAMALSLRVGLGWRISRPSQSQLHSMRMGKAQSRPNAQPWLQLQAKMLITLVIKTEEILRINL